MFHFAGAMLQLDDAVAVDEVLWYLLHSDDGSTMLVIIVDELFSEGLF